MGRMHACIYLIRGRQPVYLDHTSTGTPHGARARAPRCPVWSPSAGSAPSRANTAHRVTGARRGGGSLRLSIPHIAHATTHSSDVTGHTVRHKHISTKEVSHKAHYQFLLSHALHSYSTEGVAARTSTSFLPCTSRMAQGSGSFTKARGLLQPPPPRRPYGSASVSSNLPPSACARASCAASTRSCRVSAATETAHRSRVLRVCSACSLSRGAR